MDALRDIYVEITNELGQSIVSLPVWLQAPVVTTAALILCGIGAVVLLRVIDLVGSRIHTWVHPGAVVSRGGAMTSRPASAARGTKIVVNQEPVARKESTTE
ncbi:hypothetical protein CCICO_03065 [Corynebacterium ciconiae DSM 44920]|uniref:hypothetical protein n=1 Tax=Corynebacterium ciconiae TaxID=227319 RepID=UPI000373B9F4|nr:hypothetical protein [Corynebacterium ciconiae]WKD60658.1 hypothetical protein CCICO_03065 [Corynebacterium ciconiae DSM 44920]